MLSVNFSYSFFFRTRIFPEVMGTCLGHPLTLHCCLMAGGLFLFLSQKKPTDNHFFSLCFFSKFPEVVLFFTTTSFFLGGGGCTGFICSGMVD